MRNEKINKKKMLINVDNFKNECKFETIIHDANLIDYINSKHYSLCILYLFLLENIFDLI